MNTQDDTNIHQAAAAGDLNSVRSFIEKKEIEMDAIHIQYEVNKGDEEGKTPLWLAAENGHLELVEYLVGKYVNVQARKKCCFEIVEFLLKQDESVEDNEFVDIQAKTFEVMKYLLNKDEYVEKLFELSCYKMGVIPLCIAAKVGYLEAVKLLVEMGQDIQVVTDDGNNYTPLHYAAEEGNLEVVKYLVEKDAYTGAPELYDKTPLYCAASAGHLEVVKYLVEKGASIIFVFEGQNPLYAAIGEKRDNYENDPSPKNEGHFQIVEYLVDNKVVDINAIVDSGGVTPLHHAVRHKCSRMVKLLLEKGADIEAENEEGKTPLDCAITLTGTLSLISLLSNAGGKINLTNENWLILNRNLPLNDHRLYARQEFLEAEEGCSFLEKTTGLLNILDASMDLNPDAAVTIRQTLFRHIQEMIIKVVPSTIAPIVSQDIGVLPIILKRDILPIFKKDLVHILKEQDKLEDCNILSEYLKEKDNIENLLDEESPNFSDKLTVSFKIVKKFIRGLLELSCESFKKVEDGLTLKLRENPKFVIQQLKLAHFSGEKGIVENITSFLCKEEQAKLLIACGCVKFSESSKVSNSQTDGGAAVVANDQDASSAESHNSSSESTILNPDISGEAIRTISDVANVNDEPNSELMGC